VYSRTLAHAHVFYRGGVNWLLDVLGGWFSGAWQQRFFRAKAEQSEKPWREKARAHRTVVLPLNLDAAQAVCRSIITALGSERPTSGDGYVEAVTPGNWRSSGTVVRTKLDPGDGETTVTVTAWPGAQLFDWGESRRVARLVADQLVRRHT
jgi:hypothetical protein